MMVFVNWCDVTVCVFEVVMFSFGESRIGEVSVSKLLFKVSRTVQERYVITVVSNFIFTSQKGIRGRSRAFTRNEGFTRTLSHIMEEWSDIHEEITENKEIQQQLGEAPRQYPVVFVRICAPLTRASASAE